MRLNMTRVEIEEQHLAPSLVWVYPEDDANEKYEFGILREEGNGRVFWQILDVNTGQVELEFELETTNKADQEIEIRNLGEEHEIYPLNKWKPMKGT